MFSLVVGFFSVQDFITIRRSTNRSRSSLRLIASKDFDFREKFFKN